MELGEIGLSDGESVDSSVTDRDHNVVLLTNKRVVQVRGKSGRREATFICLENIDSVDVSRDRKGYGAYVWGVAAFLVAIGIYAVWDHPAGRIAAALAVAAMGAFLVVDHLITPKSVTTTFRAGSSMLQCSMTGSRALREMYVLVNSLFRLKHREEPEPPRIFALR